MTGLERGEQGGRGRRKDMQLDSKRQLREVLIDELIRLGEPCARP